MGTAPVSVAPVSSLQLGMGAVPYVGGVTFRVWARFAPSVSVVGDFNTWNTAANPLAPDGSSGYWSVDVPGLKAGVEYLFFIPGAGNGGYRMDPYASKISDSSGNLHAVVASRDTPYITGNYATPSWKEAVLYEIHIPTFTTDPANPSGQAGTLSSALTKLGDLADLGINAIELMPLGEFEGLSATGYNPGYIFAVEDTYGGPDEFRDFVNTAHGGNVAVIVDVVYNHTGNTDLWQFDGWYTPNQFCPYDNSNTQGGIYFYEDSRAHTDFAHTRFDYGRKEVQDYLADNAMKWLQDRFADGLRFDSVVNIRGVQVNGNYQFDIADGKDLLRRINGQIQSAQSWKLTIAEDLQGHTDITDSLDTNGFGFGAQWNNDFCFALRRAVLPTDDSQRDMNAIGDQIAAISGPAAFRSIIYSENHDRDDPGQYLGGRLPDMISPGSSSSWPAKKRSTLAAAVVLTSPGIPMLFEGQEFLEYRPFPTNGSPNPSPIDWALRAQFSGIRSLYRDLIHLRRNWFNNTRGLHGPNTHALRAYSDNVLVYHRWDQGGPGDDVIVVCNFANNNYASYTIGLPRPGLWRVRFNSDAGDYDAYFGNWHSFDTMADGPAANGMPCSGNIGIAAYTCIILSQD